MKFVEGIEYSLWYKFNVSYSAELIILYAGHPCNRLIVDMIANDTSRGYPNLNCQPIACFDCRLVGLAAGSQ